MNKKAADNPTNEWFQLRKKLYLQIKSEVARLLGDSWSEMHYLEKKYAKELIQSWRSVRKDEFYEDLVQSDIILIGDFHALQQSQRAQLRILREWPKNKPYVLAVEFLQSRHQKFVDLWMQRKLSEKEFLKKVNWIKSWGFPWEHYKPLFELARAHKVPIVGINWSLKQTNIKTLQTRENFSVICLKKNKVKYPNHKIIMIYGDLHLSKNQLPKAIKKNEIFRKSKLIRVFQNSESLYFQSLGLGLESKIEIVKLKSGDYCIQSVPPWIKWQSYLLFLENTYDRQLDDIDIDPTDHVGKLVDFLSEEYQVKIKKTNLAIYTANDTSVFLKIRKKLNKNEWLVVKRWITDRRSFYIPELEMGYLGQITVNHTATLSGEFVHSILSGRQKIYNGDMHDFERQIWIHAMTYLSAKIINHKRKTNSLDDIRKSLLMKATNNRHRQVLILALQQKVKEIRYITHGQWLPLKSHSNTDLNIYSEASRLLGAMLGEKIHTLYQSKKKTLKWVKTLMKIPLSDEDFPSKYYDLLKLV